MTYGPTPNLGSRQKLILKTLKSQPLNVYRLSKKLGIRLSWIERSLEGLTYDHGLVESRHDPVYGWTYRVTPKGKAIAARKGVLS